MSARLDQFHTQYWMRRTLAASVAALLIGCGGSDVLPPEPVASVSILPTELTLDRGQRVGLQARVLTADGAEATSSTVSWSSRDASIATISSRGEVQGVKQGATQIVAAVGGRTASATVTVTDLSAGVPASLSLNTTEDFIWIGDTITIRAQARDRWGDVVPLPTLQWSSALPDVAEVSPTGTLRTRTAGVTFISATAGTVTASIPIIVDSPSALSLTGPTRLVAGTEAQLTLTLKRGARSDPVSAVLESASSSDPRVATISANGLVSAVGRGDASISAMARGVRLRLDISVTALSGRIAVFDGVTLKLISLDGRPDMVVVSPNGSPIRASEAAISPDGRQMAFECAAGVCWFPLDGSAASSLVIAGGTSPSWTRDSRKLAARVAYTELAVADLAASSEQRFRTNTYLGRPRISPHGNEMAYECDYTDPYGEATDLCIAIAHGPGVLAFIQGARRPAWSPDGKRIAYTDFGGRLCAATRTSLSDCTVVMSGTPDEMAMEAAWSPDGAHLVVARASGLWLVEPGQPPMLLRRATGAAVQFMSPSWGADP